MILVLCFIDFENKKTVQLKKIYIYIYIYYGQNNLFIMTFILEIIIRAL